jgi:hypothetical protein
MNLLALAFALEAGIAPMDLAVIYDPPTEVLTAPVFYQQLEARVWLGEHFFLGGSLQAQEWKVAQKMEFWPFRISYELEAGLAWGPLEIGARRYCTHPVMPLQPFYMMKPEWEAAYWQLYLRLEASWNR